MYISLVVGIVFFCNVAVTAAVAFSYSFLSSFDVAVVAPVAVVFVVSVFHNRSSSLPFVVVPVHHLCCSL